jgi:Fe-S-cluster containining protein
MSPDQPRSAPMSPSDVAGQLCLRCGLCCNGVLFRDVELQAGEDAAHLRHLGLPVRCTRSKSAFPQPCIALGSNLACRIYGDRPARCRDFECALFKAVATNRLEPAAALKTIRAAQRRVSLVKKLLERTGDFDDTRPLRQRFNRAQRRCESDTLAPDAISAFAELTVAVHGLNVILSQHFYPGSPEAPA